MLMILCLTVINLKIWKLHKMFDELKNENVSMF